LAEIKEMFVVWRQCFLTDSWSTLSCQADSPPPYYPQNLNTFQVYITFSESEFISMILEGKDSISTGRTIVFFIWSGHCRVEESTALAACLYHFFSNLLPESFFMKFVTILAVQ